MSKKLDELLNQYSWNNLQIQQLRMADKKGLDLSYFDPRFDWEQLREIRQCLEDGLDPSFLLDRHINSDSMKRSREAIYEASGTFLKNKEIAKAHKRKRLIMTFTFLLSPKNIFNFVIVGLSIGGISLLFYRIFSKRLR